MSVVAVAFGVHLSLVLTRLASSSTRRVQALTAATGLTVTLSAASVINRDQRSLI